MIALLLGIAAALAQSSDGVGECVDYGTLFENVSTEAGVRAYVNGLGANLNDFDGDGDVDLFAAAGPSMVEYGKWYPGEDLLYLNDGDLTFTEAGGAAGLGDPCEDRAPMFGDLDNDGLPDLYLTVNGTNVLYRNLGGGRFEDVTAKAGAAGHRGWGHQGFLFDYDRDGWLDVFFTNGPEDGSGFNALLRNERDGTFRDVSIEAGVAGDPSGKGTCVLDADGDGWPDVFVTTGREFGNHLFMNQQDGTFADEAVERGLYDPLQRFGVGAACGDLDDDGDDDIFLVTHDKVWSGNQLFENRGDGTFVDVAAEAGVADWLDGHGQALVDIDNDGLLDIVLSGIKTTPYVLMNTGGMRFERACNGAGIAQQEGITWAVVPGDMTFDGYPEIYIANGLGRRPRDGELFRHAGGTNHWLQVEVRGLTHNPSQLGAHIEVEADGVTRYRRVGAWSSFDSQGPLPVVIGLGTATVADRVRITFTNGAVAELEDVQADQAIVVEEPDALPDADRDGVPDDWDICPGTRSGRRTDAEGCATGQRGGLALGLVEPTDDAVYAQAPTFRWEGDTAAVVVQVSFDGTFGPAGRVDWGPVYGSEYQPTPEQWEEVVAETDGTTTLLWRVAALAADGTETISEARRFHAAVPSTRVHVPMGSSFFQPAHITVPAGSTVTWWNDSVTGGNLQAEPHDVQLIDPNGLPLTNMRDLEAAGFYSYQFQVPGKYFIMCHRHSGDGTHGDSTSEGRVHVHREGPYRCMTGTIVVE